MMHMPHSALLIAHDRKMRNKLRDMLEEFGIEVWVVWRSDTAITLLEGRSLGGAKRQFELVVTERDMPSAPTVSFVDDLRATPALAGIPVLVVTSRITDADRMIAHRLRNCRFALSSANESTFRTNINLLTLRE